HRARRRWSESVSVPPRRMVMNRGSRSLGRITDPRYGGAARPLDVLSCEPGSKRDADDSTTHRLTPSHRLAPPRLCAGIVEDVEAGAPELVSRGLHCGCVRDSNS